MQKEGCEFTRPVFERATYLFVHLVVILTKTTCEPLVQLGSNTSVVLIWPSLLIQVVKLWSYLRPSVLVCCSRSDG